LLLSAPPIGELWHKTFSTTNTRT